MDEATRVAADAAGCFVLLAGDRKPARAVPRAPALEQLDCPIEYTDDSGKVVSLPVCQQDLLVREGECTRVFLDAQGRSMYVSVLKDRFVRRQSELTDAELAELWRLPIAEACEHHASGVVDARLNSGSYQNVAHVHLKVWMRKDEFQLRWAGNPAYEALVGRLPVHVNDRNAEPTVRNPSDPIGGYAGIPVNMTSIAQKMAQGGYRTHMTGKWDVGMATPRHSPIGRGYESWLGYYHHANDYWHEGLPFLATGTVDVCNNRFVDLWQDHGPASTLNGTAYEEELFTNHSLAVIRRHDATQADHPLFLVHAFHIVHTPLQVPDAALKPFGFIDYENRRKYAAMTHYMDSVVGQMVQALKAKAMWERTLVMFTSDNGGPIYYPGSASNHPLKGGKLDDWEGGVRVNAFLAGGFVPSAARGKKLDALMHIADWYATFASLAGVDGTADPEAAAVGLPPVDSINMWPLVASLGTNALATTSTMAGGGMTGVETMGVETETSRTMSGGGPLFSGPRSEVHLSSQALIQRGEAGQLYKLVIGWQTGNGWVGAVYPNKTGHQPLPSPPHRYPPLKTGTWVYDCGGAGCLYDVAADETEHHERSADLPHVAAKLRARLDELNQHNYQPDRGSGDPNACAVAEKRYGGFYGPFVGV